jgi:hypothetical protein
VLAQVEIIMFKHIGLAIQVELNRIGADQTMEPEQVGLHMVHANIGMKTLLMNALGHLIEM